MFFRQISIPIAVVALIQLGANSESLVRRADVNKAGLLDLKAATSQMTLLEKYPLGDPHATLKTFVQIFEKNSETELSKRSLQHDAQGRTIVDLTPSNCTSQTCYEGSFQPPNKKDCDAIVAAQLYNSTGSLRAFPGTFVYVTTGECAVVFQNPKKNANYTLDYNWATLGKVIQGIEGQCFREEQPSIGGICHIKNYLNYTLDSVGISLQRIINQ